MDLKYLKVISANCCSIKSSVSLFVCKKVVSFAFNMIKKTFRNMILYTFVIKTKKLCQEPAVLPSL